MDAIARSYTTRELPVSEWSRLGNTELSVAWPHLDPTFARVLVVEDGEGRIVGCWSLMKLWHVEGIWIDPEHRGKSSVARRLLSTMRQWIRDAGAASVLTGANNAQIERILDGLGATPLPVSKTYQWTM